MLHLVRRATFGPTAGVPGDVAADHGHGGAMLLLGGGLNGGRVHGRWPGLAPAALDHGDLAGANDYRDVLAEMLATRLGVGNSAAIFPDHRTRPIGAFTG